MEFLAGDAALKLTVADYGPSDKPRVGLLDSFENWVMLHYGGGIQAGLRVDAVDEVIFDSPVNFPGNTEDYIGATIWAWSPNLPPALRRSWRIRERRTSFLWSVETTEPMPQELVGLPFQRFPGREFYVMRTHTQSPTHRPDYIRGANPVTGLFEDESEGYYFE